MALIGKNIPNLINGVSQQPTEVRLPSQCEAQVNMFSSVVDGLRRRPATRHIAKLLEESVGNAMVHVYSRDKYEKYIVVVIGGDVRVFDFDGVERTVAKPSGTAYLATATPMASLRAVTVADYTFILNKEVVAEAYDPLEGTTLPNSEIPYKEGLVFIRLGDYGTKYTIKVDGTVVATHTTGTTDRNAIQTNVVANALYTAAAAAGLTDIAVTLQGNVIRFKAVNTTRDFTLEVADSSGDRAMIACKGRIQSFADLPASAFDGFTIKVAGQDGIEGDDYYVAYTTSNADGEKTSGTWREVSKKGLRTRPKPSTMPHRLVSNADGTFTFEPIEWEARAAGDEDSAPDPSFIGYRINDVFFYKNRLGLLSEENVILSEAGEYYRFYPSTVIQFLDTHPIDVAVTNDSISILQHAVPFNETLLLFSDRTQFIVAPADKLTAETIAVDVTTRFEASLQAKPVGAGKNIFFATRRGPFSSLREYYVDAEANVNDASDIASHCPEYIEGEIVMLSASPNEDVIVCVTDARPNSVYAYKFYWQGNEKVQSSWSRWDFSAPIAGMAFIDSQLTMVFSHQDGTTLETMFFADDGVDAAAGFNYEVCLDRKVFVEVGEPLPWTTASMKAVDTSGAVYDAAAIAATLDGSGLATKAFVIGVPYHSYYEFSRLVLLDGDSRVAPLVGRLQLRSMTLKYVDSGYFKFSTQSGVGEVSTTTFNGRRLGASTNLLGVVPIDSGRFRTPVLGHAPDTRIWLETSSHLPAAFLSAEWEAVYHRHSKRI